MPYRNEYASGDSLWRLVQSESVKEFEGTIRRGHPEEVTAPPRALAPPRGHDRISRIIVIDGSTVTSAVRTGYPGAEAALLQLAAVIIDLSALRNIPPGAIPRPSAVRAMEDCTTLDAVLPGRNVVRRDVVDDTPKRFFRATFHEMLSGKKVDSRHETLVETMRAITSSREAFLCPAEDCEETIPTLHGTGECPCPRREQVFEIDSLRLHERFEDHGSSAQAFTAARQVVEHLALVNIMRIFERRGWWNAFLTTAFVMDGPLAIFGMPAWLKHHLQGEVSRLHKRVVQRGGPGIMLFGVEKSGMFLEHLKALDQSDHDGPRARLDPGSALAPDREYVHSRIALRPPDDESHGSRTDYGRRVLYKNRLGQHSVVMTPIVNAEGEDRDCVDEVGLSTARRGAGHHGRVLHLPLRGRLCPAGACSRARGHTAEGGNRLARGALCGRMNRNGSRNVPTLTGFRTAESRWARLGPYYAMFPIEFARQVVEAFSKHGDTVLDPFCGRGTAPYVAMVSGRSAAGCDINPVAWLYAAVKTDPHPSLEDVARRIDEVARAVRGRDCRPADEFQALAFGRRALGFVNAARRELRWRESALDRTVAGLLLHYLHAKLGQGLSNQLRPTKAMSPDYSVRWWRKRGLTIPPDIDAAAFLHERAAWRYAKGVPENAGSACVRLGDAADMLVDMPNSASLVLTSPPYSGVTNYWADNWLRLWALGEGASRPDWSSGPKFCNAEKYESMLLNVLRLTRARSRQDAVWCLRVDARERTLAVVRRVMASLLPGHRPYERQSPSPRRTQTTLYGDHRTKPGDIDLLYLPSSRRKPVFPKDFRLVRSAKRRRSGAEAADCVLEVA